MAALQAFVNNFGFGISKKALVEKAYHALRAEGHACYIINELYINVDGEDLQAIKSRKENRWIVKAF